MIITYEGTNITDDVEVDRCVYEARDLGAIPWLSVEFADDSGLWDRWAPKPGDCIAVSEEGASPTGKMYVDRVVPYSGGYAIRATALPIPDVRATREWRSTTLRTVFSQMSQVLGLDLAIHGVTDMRIAYAKQADELAGAFMTRLAILAGCVIDVYDGVLHLCAREWIESQAVAGQLVLNDDSEFSFTRNSLYASCSINQPAGLGAGLQEFYGDGDPCYAMVLTGNVAFDGSAELRRACASVLANENAKRSCGHVRSDTLTPFSPGAVCAIECDGTPSVSGRGIVTRVRNDFAEGTSKTWWRSI